MLDVFVLSYTLTPNCRPVHLAGMGLEFFSCACVILPVCLSSQPLPGWIPATGQSWNFSGVWVAPYRRADSCSSPLPYKCVILGTCLNVSESPFLTLWKGGINMKLNEFKYSKNRVHTKASFGVQLSKWGHSSGEILCPLNQQGWECLFVFFNQDVLHWALNVFKHKRCLPRVQKWFS